MFDKPTQTKISQDKTKISQDKTKISQDNIVEL